MGKKKPSHADPSAAAPIHPHSHAPVHHPASDDDDTATADAAAAAVDTASAAKAQAKANGVAKRAPITLTEAAPVITAEGVNPTEHKHHLSVAAPDEELDEDELDPEENRLGGHSPMGAPSPPASFFEIPLSTILADEKRDKSMDISRIAVDKAKHDTTGRVYRVYSDGVFDMFHLGHMRMLEQAKKSLGDVKKVFLLCGVCDDEMVNKYKGKTVMNHKLRCDSASHCRWVDQVVPDAPWVIDDAFIEKYSIDFVAHDALPYADASGSSAASGGDVYAHIKERGMFLETQRTEGLSTSDLIVQIVRDYDDYVLRNLDRGYTKEQLNVGATWELRSKMHVKNKNLKAALTNTRANYKETSDAIKAFVSTFNPKHLLARSDSSRRMHMKPGAYYQHLKEHIPQKRSDIIHHSVGLARAVVSSSLSVLSYLNLASYCKKTKPVKKE